MYKSNSGRHVQVTNLDFIRQINTVYKFGIFIYNWDFLFIRGIIGSGSPRANNTFQIISGGGEGVKNIQKFYHVVYGCPPSKLS